MELLLFFIYTLIQKSTIITQYIRYLVLHLTLIITIICNCINNYMYSTHYIFPTTPLHTSVMYIPQPITVPHTPQF